MISRLLPCAALALLLSVSLSAQTFRPLAGYEQLQPAGKSTTTAAKMSCEFDATGLNVVLPGAELVRRIRIDTSGLGADVTYVCDNCDAARFGTATFANDTLIYGADAGAEQGLDTLELRAENGAGESSPIVTFVVLVRRAGREITVDNLTLSGREAVFVTLPPDELPGGATCRTIESCAPDYAGREREFSFNTDLRDGNDFRYRAAGLAGQDAVCVTLCNDLGLCDVYRTNFTVTVAPAAFPFFDDFSGGGIRPRADLWQDQDVLINRNFAVAPPSIGVATFDGVDFGGQAYPAGSGGRRTLIRDYLTSAPVNLSGRAGVELDFWLQPRGLGNRPEVQDSFIVQFLDNAGTWRTVFARGGLLSTSGNDEIPPFQRERIPLTTTFYHANFQFRFANRSSEQGAVDMWHLDYVRLDEQDNSPADLALVDEPPYLLADYTALPLRHLRAAGAGLFNDSITLVLQNLGEAQTAEVTVDGPTSQITVSGGSSTTPFSAGVGILSQFAFGTGQAGENLFSPGEMISRRTTLPGLGNLYAQLEPYLLRTADESVPFSLAVTYDLRTNGEAGSAYAPAIRTNNTATTITDFRNYMAYDDGSAEVTLEGSPGTTILQEYTAFTGDVLTGLSIRLPRLTSPLGNQPLRLVIYSGEGQPETLEYSEDFDILRPEDFFEDSLQGFTTYLLAEEVTLPEGPFYVGWEQQNGARNIGVGFDRSTSPTDVQWFDNGPGFRRLTGSTTGAIMIRPLLAGFDGTPTSTDNPALATALTVWPNPTNGAVEIRLNDGVPADFQYRLFSVTGAVLGSGRLEQRLELAHLPAGVYFLEVSDGVRRGRHKIIRQ